MPEAAGRVNGITDDMLKGAPAIGDALDAFLDFIGEDAVLAGHNIASFDIPFVANAAAKSGRVFIYPYVIDTLEAREGEARLLPQCLSPFIPPHQGVPRQVGSRDVRMEERQALRCHHSEGDLRRGDLLLCAEDRRQWGLLLGHELWKALGAAREGHRKTGGPSLIC